MRAWLVGVFMLLAPTVSHATYENWFEKARDGYVQHILDGYRYRGFCDGVADVGFSISLSRMRGEGEQRALDRADRVRSAHHPLITYAPYVDYAVDFASQVTWHPQEVRQDIKSKCISGEGIFETPYNDYRSGLISPDPTDNDVLEFACKRGYGPKASMLYHAMYVVGMGKSQVIERSVSPDSIMTTSIQREIVRQIYRDRPPSAEEAREQIQNECMSLRGMFEIK